MRKTVFFAPDLHKRDVDFTSIVGYREAVELVQKDMLSYLCGLEDGMFVSLGDWYDKGYRSTGRMYIDGFYDREISKAVNGEAYLCIGNHFFLERDANPEMYIIQPSPFYTPKDMVPMRDPLFRTVDHIRIGNTQISFFHFNKLDKNYVQPAEDGVTFHVGVYHDDCVLPSDVRQQAGYFGTTSNAYLSNIYSNVDLAIVGHIHAAIGVRVYDFNSKTVPIVIPGALAITENTEVAKHKSVLCPVLEIDENDCRLKFQEISTHMEVLKFHSVAKQKTAEELTLMGGGDTTELVTPSVVSLKDFLYKKNYSERDVETLLSIRQDTNLTDIMRAISEV